MLLYWLLKALYVNLLTLESLICYFINEKKQDVCFWTSFIIYLYLIACWDTHESLRKVGTPLQRLSIPSISQIFTISIRNICFDDRYRGRVQFRVSRCGLKRTYSNAWSPPLHENVCDRLSKFWKRTYSNTWYPKLHEMSVVDCGKAIVISK